MHDVSNLQNQGSATCIATAWVDGSGDMTVFVLYCEIGMRAEEVEDRVMHSQVALAYQSPHQKAWPVQRHNASIISALQRVEAQEIK